MKTYKHLFDEMLNEENIEQCFHDAAKRKTTRPEVARVLKPEREVGNDRLEPQCLQEHVKALQKILKEEKYHPPDHKKQLINEYSCGKIREIIKPEFQYEQVVHHCIIKQLQPIVMHGLYEHAMGSIPDRGCHSGKKQIEKWIRSYKGKKFYILKADVRHCFDTEDINVIEEKLKRVIKDEKFVRLCKVVMEHEATWKRPEFDKCWIEEDKWKDIQFLSGLPLGFVTSQWFTQLNYKAFDHKVMEDWKELGGVDKYTRYADDLVVMGRNKRKLHRLQEVMAEYLKEEMHQKMKYNWQIFRFEYPDRKAPPVIDRKTGKARPKTRGRALDFMGFVFHYNRTTLRKSILKRSTRKAHKLAKKEKVNWYDAAAMLSSMGWYTHTDTYGFYEDHIKPYVNIKKLKRIVSKHAKKEGQQNDVRMVQSGKHG
uniref:Reverse transcriptase domain-containing protein n=1 Tax=Myoviridae sp. ctBvM24 TaxID=2825050 RepID=A0A8S5UD21_9CAUD|nr:MAG TPA: hypothetical protein [Myoviridae sp. ctBvM24]